MSTDQWPFVVGVTGGIGSGKTAATDYFAELGIVVVDADLAARVIMEPGRQALSAVAAHFGEHVIQDDGTLDRAALRSLVFAEPEQRLWLEQLTHPLIGEELITQIGAAQSPYVILASPLLLEGSQKDLCRYIIVVDVSDDTQLKRTMARDSNDEDQVRRIMAAQLSRQQRLDGADTIISNEGTLEQLKDEVARVHAQLLALVATTH